jgi:6-phosphogluconolactonase/glucosamine-6-phosphate isomerase/deaminase
LDAPSILTDVSCFCIYRHLTKNKSDGEYSTSNLFTVFADEDVGESKTKWCRLSGLLNRMLLSCVR